MKTKIHKNKLGILIGLFLTISVGFFGFSRIGFEAESNSVTKERNMENKPGNEINVLEKYNDYPNKHPNA